MTAPGNPMIASARRLLNPEKALSISLGARTPSDWICSPSLRAASSVWFRYGATFGRSKYHKTATREILGTVSLRSSIRFPDNSGARLDNPVIFPPGRAWLAIRQHRLDRRLAP